MPLLKTSLPGTLEATQDMASDLLRAEGYGRGQGRPFVGGVKTDREPGSSTVRIADSQTPPT